MTLIRPGLTLRLAGRGAAALLSATLVGTLVTGPAAPPASAASPDARDIGFHDWTSATDFLTGRHDGTLMLGGQLVFGRATGRTAYVDPFGDGTARTYEQASWTSPEVRPGFGLTELIASWNATTPAGTWIEVAMSGRSDQGATTKWYVLGRWNSDIGTAPGAIHRTSVPSQGDQVGRVAVDTFVAAKDRSLDRWRLKVTLYRQPGVRSTPVVRSVGAMASRLPAEAPVTASPGGGAWGRVLDVPAYSQQLHRGKYPQWGGGGQAWCSATSTAMLLDYWHAGPSRRETSWVEPGYADPQVAHAARAVFDHDYDGAGNWPFNTAYAGSRPGIDAFVTRLRSLTEAEQFIKAGIPLIASVSFEEEDLPGAGYGTDGHLMVIVGFDAAGNVVVNDPASHLVASNDEVRTTYDRKAFENVWVPHSGGVVYVVRPSWKPLPRAGAQPNW